MQRGETMKIFTSYSHEDRAQVQPIVSLLTKAGLDVWDTEKDLIPGGNWPQELAQALEQSHVMIVFLSPNSVKSPWVKREVEYALTSSNYSGRVIAVELKPTPDVPWILRKFQILRANNNPAEISKRIATALRPMA